MEAIAARETHTPQELLHTFIKATDYFGYLERNFTNSAERRENILSLIQFAAEFEDPGLFLEQVALLQANDDLKKHSQSYERPSLTLATIHLAKGLEFDRVFLVGASEGLLPHARSLQDLKELEEERRLMYVAMTRARRELTISFFDIPSRFISELPLTTFEFLNPISSETEFTDGEERYITLD